MADRDRIREGDDDDDRPRRRRRDDDRDRDDDYNYPRREVQLSWLDRQFGQTSIVVLVLFALCCNGIALIFGIVGLATCQDPKARSNALIVTIIGGVSLAIGIAIRVMAAMQEAAVHVR